MPTRVVQLLVLLTCVPLLSACGRPADTRVTGTTMATTYSIRVRDCPLRRCAETVAALAEARLDELNKALSHYEAGSAISRFNQHVGRDWVAVPEDLAVVAAAARELAVRTNGAFDPTVAPAVNAWGFGTGGTLYAQPDPIEVAASLRAIGFAGLQTRSSPPALQKAGPELQLDLSGIAKGYAVDQLALLLEHAGVTDYLIEIGGEVRVAGLQPAGKAWRIAIEPRASDMPVDYIVVPGDGAVATSGDYRNYYFVGERRVSHTIDPSTGEPVDHPLAAVSVIARSAMEADGLATALLVMGPEAGSAFALEHDLAALFFVRSEAGIRARMTPAFTDYLLAD